MEKIPRHVDIDYSKYAPDIPEDQLKPTTVCPSTYSSARNAS